jgi:hypothetical protein
MCMKILNWRIREFGIISFDILFSDTIPFISIRVLGYFQQEQISEWLWKANMESKESPIYDSLSFKTSCYDSAVSINNVITFMKRKKCYISTVTHTKHTHQETMPLFHNTLDPSISATTHTSEYFVFPLTSENLQIRTFTCLLYECEIWTQGEKCSYMDVRNRGNKSNQGEPDGKGM